MSDNTRKNDYIIEAFYYVDEILRNNRHIIKKKNRKMNIDTEDIEITNKEVHLID